MTVFNNNLDKLLGKNSYRDGGAKYEAENNMTCPSGCTLITEKNNYYSNMIVTKKFMEKVLVHVVSQYMTYNEIFVPPLYLVIEGPAGEGKTSQTIATLIQHDIDVLYVSASELSGAHEGDAVRIFDAIYYYAIYRKENGHCVSILIDDFHMGIANQDSKIEKTINSNLLTGRMMNLAEHSNERKIPIILTGNDFSMVYAPLIRSGRADMFEWKPDFKEKISIVKNILDPFVKLDNTEYIKFFNTFKNATVSDFAQLKNDIRKKYVWEMIESERNLNLYNISKIERKVKAFKRLDYSEIYELAKKRIKSY